MFSLLDLAVYTNIYKKKKLTQNIGEGNKLTLVLFEDESIYTVCIGYISASVFVMAKCKE